MSNGLLYEATIQGNVELLLKLIQEDPLILDRSIVTTFEETPLHVAAMLGHDQFCVELLRRKPELARELDSRGSSALHLASTNGHLGIVKTLVLIDPDMCFVRDKDGRNPFHVAAMKGKISVLKELLGAKPEAAPTLLVNECGTILHLCVEYCQFEALKLLLENADFQESINCKDSNGNTIFHLAVADKQIQTIDYLLNHAMVEVNAVNGYGLTAMDMLVQSRRDKKDMEIAERLQTAGALKAENINLTATQPESLHQQAFPNQSTNSSSSCGSGTRDQMRWEQYFNKHDEWLEKQRDALMVVASLIASMGFTAGVTPPSGVLSVQRDPTSWGSSYNRFLVYNTTSFMSSLSIILLLVSGVPIRRRELVWILMVIMWIAVSSTALTYAVSIEHHLQSTDELPVLHSLLVVGFVAWVFLMAILLLFHTTRISLILVRKSKKPSRGDETV